MESETPNSSLCGTLPWTRSCFVCGQDNPHGLRLHSRVEAGRVLLDYATRDADRGWQHIVHGGITMTLLDEVMTWAAILHVRRPCVAAENSTRLRKPIPVGARLRVAAQVTRSYGRLILTEATAHDEAGALMASATGKYVPMPESGIKLCSKDFVAHPDALDPATLFDAASPPQGTPNPEGTPP